MKTIAKMSLIALAGIAAFSCKPEKEKDFKYTLDQFADIKVMRYTVPGWEELSLQQKAYAYHLAEATKWGNEIHWDQNCKHNITLKHTLEAILKDYDGDKSGAEWAAFEEYAKRVFFSAGIHHHYAEDKFFPGCPAQYFDALMSAVGTDEDTRELLLAYMYDPDLYPQRRSTRTDGDIVALLRLTAWCLCCLVSLVRSA